MDLNSAQISKTNPPAFSKACISRWRQEGMKSRTLPATFPSEQIYISPALNNFFKLPVAELKLVPMDFFSYVRSSSSAWASFPSACWEMVVVDILRAGRVTNSYGVPDRLSSLEVLAVGVWLSEGVVRLEMVLRPWLGVGRRFE